MQDEDEFESASQVSGPRQPFWESCLPPGQSGGSLSQKQPKDLMASKEMLSMEKHLTEPDKDCAAKTLTVESEMGSSLDMQSKSPMSNYHGDLSQTVLGQTLRPQTPTSLFGKEIPPWSQRGKLPQSSSPQNSRDGIPNNQYNRPQTSLTQGSRPATSNSQLYQTTRSSNPGNKEVFNNPNRMALPISHTGRRLSSPVNQAGKTAENPLQRSHLSELLVTHQPWTLPSDTESEGVDQEQDEGL